MRNTLRKTGQGKPRKPCGPTFFKKINNLKEASSKEKMLGYKAKKVQFIRGTKGRQYRKGVEKRGTSRIG